MSDAKALMPSTNSLLWELPWVWQTRKALLCLPRCQRTAPPCRRLWILQLPAGAATAPLKVHVVSALDPEVIVVVEKPVPVVLAGRAYG